jgi:uncharacterized tellurite resistance protein B-like protein
MRAIQRLLGLRERTGEAVRESEVVQRVAAELGDMPVEQARYLAGFAYVLARLAHTDLEFAPAESAHIAQLLEREGGLPAAQAELIAELVGCQAAEHGGTEDYRATRQFAELATLEQRRALVRCLYQVAAAERGVSAREDALIRQIAHELRLSHAEALALRAPFCDQLAELRGED